VRKGGKSGWQGARDQSTVWDIHAGMGYTTQTSGQDARTGHGTQKSVDCMKRPIENNSRKGDAVYEPFAGSGTTMIAAELTGRRCLAIELAPNYVDVAVRRWQTFTSQDATLEGDGRTFTEVESDKAKATAASA
jgi:adenine specific DNA methylase Mod